MKVLIPTPLHSYTGNKSPVDASGSTIGELLRDLDRRFPGLRFRIIDEQDQIRQHVKIFVNGNQILELKTKITEKDDVAIIQAFSGG